MEEIKAGDWVTRIPTQCNGWPHADIPQQVSEVTSWGWLKFDFHPSGWNPDYFFKSDPPAAKPGPAPVYGQHTPGAKLDSGKIRPDLVLGGFARALKGVCEVGTFGAVKYTDDGWMQVPDGLRRYADADLRHWLDRKIGIELDPESKLLHLKHEAWNALAQLDLYLREQEKNAQHQST